MSAATARGRPALVLALALAACGSPDLGAARAETARDVARRAEIPEFAASSELRLDASAPSTSEAPLTEEEAVRRALERNPRVASLFARLGMAKADAVAAGLLVNPVFEGDVKFFEGREEIEGTLVAPVFSAFTAAVRTRRAEATFAAAEARVTAALVNLVYDVRRACVDVVASEEILDVATESFVAASASADMLRALHAAGNVVARRLTAEEAAEADARLAVAAAETELLAAKTRLDVLLGAYGPAAGRRVEAALATPPSAEIPDWERRAVAASLDLVAARAAIDAAAQDAGVAGSEAVFAELEAGLAAVRESSGERGVGPAAKIPLPVFDGGVARSAAASEALRGRVADYAAAAIEVRAAARRLRDRLFAAERRAAYLRDVVVPLRSRLTRETLQEFNAMQIGAPVVLAARRGELAARRAEVEARRDARLARLDAAELLAGAMRPAHGAAAGSSHGAGDAPAAASDAGDH